MLMRGSGGTIPLGGGGGVPWTLGVDFAGSLLCRGFAGSIGELSAYFGRLDL